MMQMSIEEISARTDAFHKLLSARIAGADVEIEIADGRSLVGGGSTPAQSLPTKLIRIASARHSASDLGPGCGQAQARRLWLRELKKSTCSLIFGRFSRSKSKCWRMRYPGFCAKS